jgi:hypothetical protein
LDRVLPEYSGNATTVNWSMFFWIGLVGIIATGLIVGMGGQNYWALSQFGNFGGGLPVEPKGLLLFFVGGVMVGLCDICALGVIFAGGVLVVQRLRGRI